MSNRQLHTINHSQSAKMSRLVSASNDASNAILSINNDVSNLISTVMGPEYANTAKTLMTEEVAKQIKATLAGTMTDQKVEDLMNTINALLIEPAGKKIQMDNKTTIESIESNVQTSTQKAADITAIAAAINKDTTKGNRQQSMDKLKAANSKLAEHMTNKKKCEEQILTKSKRMTTLTIDYDKLNNAEKKELQDIKNRIEDLKSAMNSITQELIKVHDSTIGGHTSIAKMTKQPLNLPEDLEDTTASAINNAFKIFMKHRAQEYYMIMHYIQAISDSYDNTDGTYYEPPSIINYYTDGQPETLTKNQIDTYTQQSESLYCVILSALKEEGMAKITQEFKCGMNKHKKAKCGVDDGVMAFYCLLAKYGKDGAHARNDLEAFMLQAPKHFQWGSPRTKIEVLQPKLSEIIRLKIPLKASLTLHPILNILTTTHPRFITLCEKYRNMGTPNDCATTIEQLFAEVDEACEEIERTQGQHVWKTMNHANDIEMIDVNQINKSLWDRLGDRNEQKGGKGKGNNGFKGKGKGKGKRKGKGKGKGDKGKGGKSKRKEKCGAMACDEDNKGYRFCIKHHKQGMEGKTITLRDGTPYNYEKPRGTQQDKNKDVNKQNYGFTTQQLRGLRAVAEHIETTFTDEDNQEHDLPFEPNNNKRKRAFLTDKQDKPTKSQKFIQAISNLR